MENITTIHDVTATFNVRIVPMGGKYGHKLLLTNNSGRTLVEFYDADYTGSSAFTEQNGGLALGQFISRYSVREFCRDLRPNGLRLDGGIPKWTLSKTAYVGVINFLIEFLESR